jgi:hypothetical protein
MCCRALKILHLLLPLTVVHGCQRRDFMDKTMDNLPPAAAPRRAVRVADETVYSFHQGAAYRPRNRHGSRPAGGHLRRAVLGRSMGAPTSLLDEAQRPTRVCVCAPPPNRPRQPGVHGACGAARNGRKRPPLTWPTSRAMRQLRTGARGFCEQMGQVGAGYSPPHVTVTDAGADVSTTGPELVHDAPLTLGDRPTKKKVPGLRSTLKCPFASVWRTVTCIPLALVPLYTVMSPTRGTSIPRAGPPTS